MLVPKLRFPEFTDEWQLNKFDQLFNFSTGKNIKHDEAAPWLETPCVRYGELYHLYNEVINSIVNYTNIPRGDLLFSNGDEILLPSAGEDPMDIGSASALTIKNVAIGRTINILRPKQVNLYDQIFVAYYINSVLKKGISKLAKGNSISNVYNSDLKKLTARLPAQVEQQKIADFLTTIDKKIESIDKKVKLLKQYKKGIIQKIFTQKIRFKDVAGNDYPEWDEKELNSVLVKSSKRNKKNEYSLVQSISNLMGFVDQFELFKNHVIASKDLSNYFVVNKGTFAYNPSRIDVGSLAYKSDETISVVSPLYICFRANNDHLIDHFLFEWFGTVKFTNQMNKSFEGSVRNTLSYDALKHMRINLPSINEQQKIANFLNSIDDKIKAEETKLASAKNFKKALLQRMFV